MTDPIRFHVPGIPAPGGSKNPIPIPDPSGPYVRVKDRRRVRIVLADAGGDRNKEWRRRVYSAAGEAFKGVPPSSEAVWLVIEFVVPRPKGHYRTGKFAGVLRPDAPLYPTVAPDLTKLVRSTEDAMKGVAWVDDSAVVYQRVTKRYAVGAEAAGANIEVCPIFAGSGVG
jgi:crossover junction endodeoxyribonuclease RusA